MSTSPCSRVQVWTMVYPTAATRSVVHIYMTVEVAVDPQNNRHPTLIFANPGDNVCDFRTTRRLASKMSDAQIELVTDSESNHTIAGAITSPSTVDRISERTVSFLKQQLSEQPPADPSTGGGACSMHISGALSAAPSASAKGSARGATSPPRRVERSPNRSQSQSKGITASWPR